MTNTSRKGGCGRIPPESTTDSRCVHDGEPWTTLHECQHVSDLLNPRVAWVLWNTQSIFHNTHYRCMSMRFSVTENCYVVNSLTNYFTVGYAYQLSNIGLLHCMEYQRKTFIACSECRTPLRKSFSVLQRPSSVILSICYVICTGCLLNTELSLNSHN